MSIKVDIYKNLGDFTLNVKFESEARRIGILGASGSGKSMTLRSIAGIETPDRGCVEVSGEVLYNREQRINLKPQERNLGYMFQNYALFPTMTVEQNIAAGVKGTRAEKFDRAAEMISRFRLDGLAKRLPGELSGGQQQRVALARIMAYRPRMIMLDEPFSALDMYLKDRMQYEMLGMLDEYDGQTIMVSHSRDELYRFSDELFVVRHGEILAGGETAQVFADPGRIEVAKMTGCKNFSDTRRIGADTLEATEWGVTVRLGREIPEDVKHIGYRAHYFEPLWDEPGEESNELRETGSGRKFSGEVDDEPRDCARVGTRGESGDEPRDCSCYNCIKVELDRIDEMPFEKKYYFRTEAGGTVCWFVQHDIEQLVEARGVPQYLKMNEKYIMLLR